MATMVARESAPLPPSIPIQEKGSRNKRKFRADPPAITYPNGLALPLQNELADYDLFPAESASEIPNFEQHVSVCDMCRSVIYGPNDEPEFDELQDADWSDFTEAQLEDILIKNLDMAFRSAIKVISSYGYSEEVATNAVLSSGLCYGCKDIVSNVVDNALTLLRSGQEVDSSPRENVSEDLRKLEKSVLADMISVLREVRPFFNTGDALWWLLMSDANVSHACAMDSNSLSHLGSEEAARGSSASQLEMSSNLNHVEPTVTPESSVPLPEKKNAMKPYPQNTLQPVMPSVVGIPSLPYGRFPASSNDGKPSESNLLKDSPISFSNHVKESSCSTTSQSQQEEKPVSTRKVHVSSSKRESFLRQKSIHFEKSYHALGSKAVMRTRKHGSLGSLMLDRKCKTISESTSISVKTTTIKLGKSGGTENSLADANLNLSFSFGHSSSSTCNAKKSSNRVPPPVANTELSLSLPTTSNGSFNPIPDSTTEATSCSIYPGSHSDKACGDWIPEDKKDEMLLMLVPIMRELQAQVQDWNDWAQQKVMQAARRLGRDKAELQTLRQEKDEVARLQKERQASEDNTKKKLAEIEGAISKASGQVERANAAARRLEHENAQLRLGMEAAKLQALESASNCQQVSTRETKTLKTFQSLERQRIMFQEELVAGKRQLSQLQQQLTQVEELQIQSEAKWKQEENLKSEALTKANAEKKEREQIETSTKSQENALLLKSENDIQRSKNDIRKLEQQIAQLRLITDSSNMVALRWNADKTNSSRVSDGRKTVNVQFLAKIIGSQELGLEDVQRERECVMCLCEEMSVVFLPCAHQVVCKQCNDLHEKQGMKDCPSCRTPIQRRINVRLADS